MSMGHHRHARSSLLLALAFAAGACSIITGLDEYELVSGATPNPGGGGSGGIGGSGGAGGCAPGASEGCYSGPDGTEGVGVCHGGTRICDADGQWGPCEGETTPMQEVCGNLVDEDCSGALCGGDVVWALAASGTGQQTVYGVAVDGAGNVLVAGTFTNEMVIGNATIQSAAGLDAFLLKVDAMGDLLSLQRFGGSGDQYLHGVAIDGAGNVYLTGYFGGSMTIGQTVLSATTQNDREMFVAKLDAQGQAIWARGYGTIASVDEQIAADIAVVGQGDVTITGTLIGRINFGPTTIDSGGSANVFLARVDTDGNPLWIQHWGDSEIQEGIAVAANNDIFVTGEAAGSFMMGGTIINAGSFRDVLAIRHDATGGAVDWASSFGNNADYTQTGQDIALDPNGNILLTGAYRGDINFGGAPLPSASSEGCFVVKLSEAGVHQWSTAFNGTSVRGRGVAADSAGNVLVIGYFSGPTDFGGGPVPSNGVDLFVAKLAPDGSHVWSRGFGDAQTQLGVAVAVDPTDHVLVAGHFLGQLDFDVATLSANGATNNLSTLFLAKLAP